MSAKAKAYIALVIVLGAAAGVRGVLTWTPHDLLRFVCYLAFAIPASALKVRLPGVMGTMSVLFVFLLAGIVELGLAETLVISAVCVVVQAYWRPKVKPRVIQTVFSVAVLFIATTAGDLAYRAVDITGLGARAPFRLALLASVFFIANTFPVAAVIALTEKRRFAQVWTEFYVWSFPYYLIGAGLAGLCGYASAAVEWQAGLLIVPTVYAIYRSYHLYLNQLEMQSKRAAEERQHAEEVDSLLRQTVAANDALRRANADLEQFAYAASHDLQEPLRNIKIYSELLQRRHSGALGADGGKLVSTITDGATRINQLIADLLSYARTGSAELSPCGLVSPGDVLAEVAEDLRERILATEAVITCDALPSVYVHRTHLFQLLQNLISNSLKYHAPERRPSLHVSAVATGEWLDVAVRDNGIGIPAVYHDRIFGVFKRLHSREVPGTGIGLAICKKIVDAYGGQIWVESTGTDGSTFHFTLPRAQRRRELETRSVPAKPYGNTNVCEASAEIPAGPAADKARIVTSSLRGERELSGGRVTA